MNLTYSAGTARSGSLDCNDITSVFAFLAFLFALLNFVVNMGGQGRRRREAGHDQCHLGEDVTSDPVYRSSVLSVHALYRGVLDYLRLLEAGEEAGGHCGARVLCQAGQQAAGGEFGGAIAVLGGHRAGWLVESLGLGYHRDTVRAVTEGVAGRDCEQLHPCSLALTSLALTSPHGGLGLAGGTAELARIRDVLSRHHSVTNIK